MSHNESNLRLAVGAVAPNATLINQDENPVALADIWRGGPTLLTFLRHFG